MIADLTSLPGDILRPKNPIKKNITFNINLILTKILYKLVNHLNT